MNRSDKTNPSSIFDPNAVQIPVFTCKLLAVTLEFYKALGTEITHEQTTPYEYGAVQWGRTHVHFHGNRKMKPEQASGCLILVDDVKKPYRYFVEELRRTCNGLPVTGFPRITRFREGHTRFIVYDPDGNSLCFIAKDEPPYTYESKMKVESKLMQAFETAVFLRDTYHMDDAAAKKLDRALLQHKPAAPVELARVLAARAELAVALGQKDRLVEVRSELNKIQLTDTEKETFRDELQSADQLEQFMSARSTD